MLNAHGDEGLGGIIDGGDLVVHEGLIEDFTILELQLLEQYSTQSLHHTALYLSLIQLGVDDVTGVAALYHLLHFNNAGLGIDLNLGAGSSGGPECCGLGRITGSGIVVDVIGQGEGTYADGGAAVTGAVLKRQTQCQIGHGHTAFGVVAVDDPAVLKVQLTLDVAQLDLSQIQKLLLQILGSQLDRITGAVGDTGGNGLPLVGGMVGIAGADGELGGIAAQNLGGNLG